jgi:chromate transporter
MVTQYVGFLGAWKLHGNFNPLFYGSLGALITTYVTFLPSFFFIFAGSPYIEALAGNKRIQAALTSVTAAVVGVILNLAVFFGNRIVIKSDGTPDGFALTATLLSFLLLWRYRLSVPILVIAGAVIGMVWSLWL